MGENEKYIHLAYLSIISIVLISSYFVGHNVGYTEGYFDGYNDINNELYEEAFWNGYDIAYDKFNISNTDKFIVDIFTHDNVTSVLVNTSN